MKKILFILVIAACPIATGCATAPKSESWSAKLPWNKDKPPKPYPNPVKMAVTWTPDILVQPGRTPTRGFGGRVYFYNDHSQAVPVEGELTIHGFDEALATAQQSDGIKRFRFTAEQFTSHFSESDLGASYSIWIPWDAAGGDQKKLSLMSTFKTTGGKVVQSEAAMVLLPGRKVDLTAAKRPAVPAVRQVGHYLGGTETHQGLNANSAMQTTTIPLPSSFQQRLARMPEQTKPSARVATRLPAAQETSKPTPLPAP
ncbi:hypothetical protein EC9_54070 [Rosistilla ulvae]|uniref:Uncharacterized protein n=1 Tax=Rosistilla ulvae TaxID=1930277 RepID=A0A517M8R6_9BACT|nr:hypothetical protein [Rosistilla ulvae]QDS91187.1 hypothetical protein EC9_54070 [Rosistilla ulvae]